MQKNKLHRHHHHHYHPQPHLALLAVQYSQNIDPIEYVQAKLLSCHNLRFNNPTLSPKALPHSIYRQVKQEYHRFGDESGGRSGTIK